MFSFEVKNVCARSTALEADIDTALLYVLAFHQSSRDIVERN